MPRFYTPGGQQINEVPKWDQSGLRPVRITDAKKNGWYASVSTICSTYSDGDGLMAWKVNQPLEAAIKNNTWELLKESPYEWKQTVQALAQKEMSKAPALGSAIHGAVEFYQRIRATSKEAPNFDTFDDSVRPYVAGVHSFCEEFGIVADQDHLERVVVIDDCKAAGTLDMRGKGFKKDRVYFDWKTQKVRNQKPNFYFKFPLQLAAYRAGDGGEGLLCSVILDTSEHPYGPGQFPSIYYQLWDNPDKYYQHFKNLAAMYYDSNDWAWEDKGNG